MRHRRLPTQAEVGIAGLALLRAWPFEDRMELVADLARTLASDEWTTDVVKIVEYDVLEGYRHWAETYDSRANPLLHVEEPATLQAIEDLPVGLTVDVACGTGRLTHRLLELGHNVLAMDASVSMLEKCRARLPAAQLCRCDLLRLPLRDGSVDAAVCGLALTHFESLREPIAELSRILRPGGRLVLSDIHPIAVTTSAHAFFRSTGGDRGVIRNQVHWPSAYIEAFRSASLAIRSCTEPVIDERVVEMIAPSLEARTWVRGGFLGLPMALIWELERM